ncbi:hypothetical protein [Streptomyces sp. NPDC057552]|uniref:hypothetical protein n=1 Tax=Streptomyces sp. NPDC057552 TaxID=3350537 RepID=UPI0036A37DCB
MTPTDEGAARPKPQQLIPIGPLADRSEPDVVHLAILGVNAREGAWRHGAALCDRLTEQGEDP